MNSDMADQMGARSQYNSLLQARWIARSLMLLGFLALFGGVLVWNPIMPLAAMFFFSTAILFYRRVKFLRQQIEVAGDTESEDA